VVAASAPPIIAIDGPSASGKGTVAEQVARRLGFHYLDSGALYRLVGFAAKKANVAVSDEPRVAALAAALDARFENSNIYLNDDDVTDQIRSEAAGAAASEVAVLPAVRQALLVRQRAFRAPPGLVADGRDMGTVVFPDAVLKIYLTAEPSARAERRYKQLIGKGMGASMAALLQDIQARDDRDSKRAIAPLQKDSDAVLLDTTNLSIDDAVEQVLARYAVATRVP
jgi:cytidylate kinase